MAATQPPWFTAILHLAIYRRRLRRTSAGCFPPPRRWLAVALAMVSAARPSGLRDAVVRVLSLAGNSLPIWLGLLALSLFYARLQWTGGPGRLEDADEYTIDMSTGLALLDAWRSGLPFESLASAYSATVRAGAREASCA